MNFFKTRTFTVISTAIITFGIVQAVSPFVQRPPVFNFKSTSDRISWDDAVRYKNEYQSFPKALKVRFKDPDSSGNFKIEVLQGFRFNAKQLDSIINRNIRLAPGEIPDDVAFYFGKDGTSSSGGLFSRRIANIHLVAVGIKDDNLLIDQTNTANRFASHVYDKADPCPPKCPR